jgi:hypothetical protein
MTAVFQTSTLSSTDFADYEWPETELARISAFMAGLPPWTPPSTKEGPGVRPNQPPSNAPNFKNDADAVVRLGAVVTSFRRLGLAIRDPRCDRPHLRVLYYFMERLNRTTGTAFPDRQNVAADEGLSVKTVENVLYDLRKWGHINWERRAAPSLHKGRLLHYTLPVNRWTEAQITEAIYALRGESTLPNRYSKSLSHQPKKYPS